MWQKEVDKQISRKKESEMEQLVTTTEIISNKQKTEQKQKA